MKPSAERKTQSTKKNGGDFRVIMIFVLKPFVTENELSTFYLINNSTENRGRVYLLLYGHASKHGFSFAYQ